MSMAMAADPFRSRRPADDHGRADREAGGMLEGDHMRADRNKLVRDVGPRSRDLRAIAGPADLDQRPARAASGNQHRALLALAGPAQNHSARPNPQRCG
ncbi:MAG TPA: hypothetical protein VGA56_01785, partial [Opitutaceae bacterium]